MKNFENDTSYLRYLNEIFRHCERMFSKAKFWISQQKVRLIKNYGNFWLKTYKCYEKCSNLILGEKIEVCKRADITDLFCIDSGGFNIPVSMFKKAFERTIFFCEGFSVGHVIISTIINQPESMHNKSWISALSQTLIFSPKIKFEHFS